jgi:hypothetical protein
MESYQIFGFDLYINWSFAERPQFEMADFQLILDYII